MREIDFPISEFHHIFFGPTVSAIRLPLSISKLQEIAHAKKIILEELDDFKEYASANLVWYKSGELSDSAHWETRGSINLTVAEAADILKHDIRHLMSKELQGYLDELKNGLRENVEIISLNDSSLHERMIVDGMHRLVVLYYLYQHESDVLSSILDSSFEISVIECSSSVGSYLLPCDFIPLCFSKGQHG